MLHIYGLNSGPLFKVLLDNNNRFEINNNNFKPFKDLSTKTFDIIRPNQNSEIITLPMGSYELKIGQILFLKLLECKNEIKIKGLDDNTFDYLIKHLIAFSQYSWYEYYDNNNNRIILVDFEQSIIYNTFIDEINNIIPNFISTFDALYLIKESYPININYHRNFNDNKDEDKCLFCLIKDVKDTLSNYIFDIKDKITDKEYMDMLNTLHLLKYNNTN